MVKGFSFQGIKRTLSDRVRFLSRTDSKLDKPTIESVMIEGGSEILDIFRNIFTKASEYYADHNIIRAEEQLDLAMEGINLVREYNQEHHPNAVPEVSRSTLPILYLTKALGYMYLSEVRDQSPDMETLLSGETETYMQTAIGFSIQAYNAYMEHSDYIKRIEGPDSLPLHKRVIDPTLEILFPTWMNATLGLGISAKNKGNRLVARAQTGISSNPEEDIYAGLKLLDEAVGFLDQTLDIYSKAVTLEIDVDPNFSIGSTQLRLSIYRNAFDLAITLGDTGLISYYGSILKPPGK